MIRYKLLSNVYQNFIDKLFLLLLICFVVFSDNLNVEPVPINIHQQQNGRGDIKQMWPHENIHGIMRNALRPDAQNRWIHYKDSKGNYVIPYVIAGKFTTSEHKIIHGAFDAIAENSCVQFKKKTDSQFDYVEIQNQRGEGCYTMVGRVPGKNEVMLEANEEATCILHQTVVHELFHSLGLWHEQMRHDRDDFIKVHYENIPNAYYPQFKKVPLVQAVTYGVQYDYTSVMHYAKDAFAMVPGALTMQTKKKNAQNIIGNAKQASAADWSKICSIYNCLKCMGNSFKRGQQLTADNNGKNKNSNKNKNSKRSRKNKVDHDQPISIWRIISLNAQPSNMSSNQSTSNTSSIVPSQQSSTSSASDDSSFLESGQGGLDRSSDTWKMDEEIEQALQAVNISLSGNTNTNTKIVVISTGEWPAQSRQFSQPKTPTEKNSRRDAHWPYSNGTISKKGSVGASAEQANNNYVDRSSRLATARVKTMMNK